MKSLANKYMAQTLDGCFVRKREKERNGVKFCGKAEQYVVAVVLMEMGDKALELDNPVQFVQTQLLRYVQLT